MKHDANANIRSDANYYVQPGVNRNDGERGASNCYERSQHHDQVYQRGVSNRYGRSQHPDQVYQRDINHDINPSCYENNNATSYIDEKHNFHANYNTPINRNYNSNVYDYDTLFRICPKCGESNHKNANKCRTKDCIRNKKND
jgi:ribosomal protein L40E